MSPPTLDRPRLWLLGLPRGKRSRLPASSSTTADTWSLTRSRSSSQLSRLRCRQPWHESPAGEVGRAPTINVPLADPRIPGLPTPTFMASRVAVLPPTRDIPRHGKRAPHNRTARGRLRSHRVLDPSRAYDRGVARTPCRAAAAAGSPAPPSRTQASCALIRSCSAAHGYRLTNASALRMNDIRKASRGSAPSRSRRPLERRVHAADSKSADE